MNKIKAVGLAAAMVVAPLAASAATVVPGGSYDLLADAYTFDGNFDIGASGDVYTFSFTNTSSKGAAVTLVGFDVRQTTAAFTGGASLQAGPLTFAFDQDDTNGAESGTFKVASGDTIDLVLTFGDVVDAGIMNGKGQAQVGFDIEAAVVPVPAAGLLLLTAIGGLGLARRRKTA